MKTLPAFVLAACLIGGLAVSMTAAADDQEDTPAAAAAPVPADDAPAEASASAPSLGEKLEEAAPRPPAGAPADLIGQLDALKAELAAYRAAADPAAKRMALLALLAAITWALLAAINRFRELSPAGKRWLPYVAVLLGVVAGILDAVATGAAWTQAAVTGLGPPLAVLVHELLKRWAKPKPPPVPARS